MKYKAYCDKKANASKLKEADCLYILQPKADHQGSKIPFTEFRWIGPYIIEKVLPNNSYLVRKIGTNKTQVLHRMRMRQFTPRQAPADITVKPQEYKSDPEVSLKITTIYTQERGNTTLSSQFLTLRRIMRRQPIHNKLRYSLTFQRRK